MSQRFAAHNFFRLVAAVLALARRCDALAADPALFSKEMGVDPSARSWPRRACSRTW